MISTTLRVRRVILATLCLTALHVFAAAPNGDEAAIRKVMLDTWDKPQARLDVGPVVIVERHAIAGWTQAEHGGRALLEKKSDGTWQVAACGGDGVTEVKTLVSAGIPDAAAQELAAALRTAEGKQPASRLAKFATFDGFMRMGHDEHNSHAKTDPALH